MRISDWSSDVCSSDLAYRNADIVVSNLKNAHAHMVPHGLDKRKFHWIPNGISMREVGQPQALDENVAHTLPKDGFVVGYEIGRASCRERGCQYVKIWVVAVELKKKKQQNIIKK